MPLLEAQHLRKSYDGHVAVADVGFELNRSEVLGLLGPNGAGKSTTMLILAGLLKADGGQVKIDGEVCRPGSRAFKFQLGVTPQDLAIYPELSAHDNLRFFGKLYGLRGKELEARCREILEQIGLTDRARDASRTFSGGMKRRLNFGISILHRPAILILDEPTVGVDPQSRSHMLDGVRELSREGVTVIYASHYMEEVEAICERVAIIDHGKLLACDAVSRLLGRMSSDVFLRVSRGAKLAELVQGLAEVRESSDGETLLVISAGEAVDRHALNERLRKTLDRLHQAGVDLKSVETHESNLERLFLELTGRKLRD